MDRQALRRLATADGHDRHVPSGEQDFLAAGHEGVYHWAVERFVRAGTAFLDLGCGTGYGSAAVAGAGGTYDGVDSSPAAIEFAEASFGRDGVRFFVGDLLEPLPAALEPGSYDVVFSSEVLEHVVDPFRFVDVMARYLREDGVCFVGTPNRLWSRDHMPEGGLLARSHVMEFSPPALEALMRSAFADVALLFRMFPAGAISAAVVPGERPRLVQGALAFAREVAPEALDRVRSGLARRRGGPAWSPADVVWVEPGDPQVDPSRCVGLVAVCRGPKRS